MMMNNTLAQLRELKLAGMASAVEEQLSSSASTALSFEERLALMVDREVQHRGDKRRAALLKRAGLKYPQACIEDVDGKRRPGLRAQRVDEPGAIALGRGWHGDPGHRANGFGQVVAGMRAGAIRLPTRALGAVPARAAPGRGVAHPARQRRLRSLARRGGAH